MFLPHTDTTLIFQPQHLILLFYNIINFSVKAEQENSLPSPKRVFFPQSSVRHGWRLGWQVGSGMQNIGNTCYLNSTLQALFHVSAFANWLISENHSEKCNQQNGKYLCGEIFVLLIQYVVKI